MGKKGADDKPVFDAEAEAAVLGCMMIDARAASIAAAMLRADDFYARPNRLLFGLLCEMSRAGQTIDQITVRDRLASAGQLDTIGGMVALGRMIDSIPSVANTEPYAGIVRTKSAVRAATVALEVARRELVSGDCDVQAVLYGACKDLTAARERLAPQGPGNPSAGVASQIEDEISGVRSSVEFPWRIISRSTKALMPGATTVLCGRKGTSKSLFILQCVADWTARQIPCSVLEIEEDRTYNLRRVLAQAVGNSRLTDDTWCRENVNETREAYTTQGKWLDTMGGAIHDRPGMVNTDRVLDWLNCEVRRGRRIVVVDPITARDPHDKPWIDDHRFIMEAAGIVRDTGASLIVVTHPRKTAGPPGQGHAQWGEDYAGGAAWGRFCQTELNIEWHDDSEDKSVTTAMGVSHVRYNRRIQLRKTRNSYGQGMELAYHFDKATLKFDEIGVVMRKKQQAGKDVANGGQQ